MTAKCLTLTTYSKQIKNIKNDDDHATLTNYIKIKSWFEKNNKQLSSEIFTSISQLEWISYSLNYDMNYPW